MSTTVLVTGGTGTLGRLVVARLRHAGRHVRVLTRRPQDISDGVHVVVGDLATGAGIDAAVAGVATIVHCAGGPKGDEDKARHLVAAASRAVVSHLVFISVVGVDRIPLVSPVDRLMFGFYGSKLGAEQVVAASGIPHSTLRATQFHDLLLSMTRALSRSPVVPAPAGFHFQPIDADEVAARLTELALGEPAGRVPDLGGPQAYPFVDLLRSYLSATGRRRPVVQVPQPGAAARAFRAGANLAPEHAVGLRTWEAFLAERVTV